MDLSLLGVLLAGGRRAACPRLDDTLDDPLPSVMQCDIRRFIGLTAPETTRSHVQLHLLRRFQDDGGLYERCRLKWQMNFISYT